MSEVPFDPSKVPPVPSSARAEPVARIDKPPILEIVENEPCPNCKQALPTTAVVCMKCGYDIVAGKVRATQVGTEAAPPTPTSNEFVTPGRLSTKPLVIIGTVLTLAGFVAALYFAPAAQTFWPRLATGLLLVYQNILHTGTGALAVAGTALALHYRLTRIDLLLARVFVAFAVMQVISSCNLPLGEVHKIVQALANGLREIVAFGAYWLLLWALFRRTPLETSIMGAVHILVMFITWVATMLEAASKG